MSRAAGSTEAKAALWPIACGWVLFGLTFTLLGCAGTREAGSAVALDPGAEQALQEAYSLWREADLARAREAEDQALEREDQARAALERAHALAPNWIAPRRLLDEELRRELRGFEAYSRRRADLADGVTSDELYLVGRWEGSSGVPRFRQAVRLDSTCGFAHHALALDHELAGRRDAALAAQKRALGSARGETERWFFGRRLAQLEASFGRSDRAVQVLRDLESRLDSGGVHAASIRRELARRELDAESPAVRERGFRRGLEVLRSQELSDPEVGELLGLLLTAGEGRSSAGRREEAWRALQAGPRGDLFDRFLPEFLRLDDEDVLFALEAADGRERPADVRAARFEEGRYREAIEGWLAELPAVCLHSPGEPVRPSIAGVVATVRHLASEPGVDERLELAEACLSAGWTREARSVLESVLEAEPADVELALAARLAGRLEATEALLAELDELLGALHANRASFAGLAPDADPESAPSSAPDTVGGLLAAVGAVFERYAVPAGLGAPANGQTWTEAIAATPRVRYGPVASLTIPSPVFVDRDEQLGHGPAGETVPGLPEALAQLGRFGLFGDVIGRAPDGVVLRAVGSREVAGEHLGIPFSGSVLYAEGADARGARQRAGEGIAGAALHEGYWIDLDAERRRLDRWLAIEERFGTAREELLARRGLELRTPASEPGLRRLERRSLAPVPDAANLVRLAVLGERDEPLTLDELMTVVETHEQGHLLDRERYLPVGKNLLGVARFVLPHALDPATFESELEYRAEAVALACASDPRLVLAELLDFAAGDDRTHGPHGKAYRRLLEDLLLEVDRDLARGGDATQGLDGDRTLIHQLHRLRPEELRSLAVRIAPGR